MLQNKLKKNNNNEKKRKIDDSVKKTEKPKIDSANNNNNNVVSKFENQAYVIIGPRNVGKTYYMLKVLEKIGNKRPIHIITRSPNQYPKYETSTEIKQINKYKGSVVSFDDMLGARNSSQIDDFLREEDMKIFFMKSKLFCFTETKY